MKPQTKYCAVYTRKSTEEGLEQDFNTLDAQREGCLAYIASQKAEGWVPVLDYYDDGGFSGGNLERPALKRLMEDIKVGKINIVVVYKIDRLTRALMDFSKLVEVFDQYGVTFVSITQSFNTTTSMGRLTLNVLLSFAQFEREVIGERVRDKIAASKKKGMWMGGNPPLGYDIEYRHLVPNRQEAKKVRHIFERYLAYGSVSRMKQELDRECITSKVITYKTGEVSGGKSFSRGALYALLSNPIYIGKIRHKDKTYDGQHEGITPESLWQAVQDKLQEQASVGRGQKIGKHINLLKGLLFDEEGTLYTPGYTLKSKKQYRYYISQNLVKLKNQPDGLLGRIPAQEIEGAVETGIREQFTSRDKVAALFDLDLVVDIEVIQNIINLHMSVPFANIASDCIERVTIKRGALEIYIKINELRNLVSDTLRRAFPERRSDEVQILKVPYKTVRQKRGAIVIAPENPRKDIFDMPPEKLKKLVQGIIWRDEHFGGMTLKDIAQRENCSEGYVGTAIFGSFDILQKTFPVNLQ